MEFMEEEAIRLVARNAAVSIPFSDAKAHLLIQLDGNSKSEIRRQKKELMKAIRPLRPSVITAKNEKTRAVLWSARRGIRTAIEKESPIFLAEDCVVPRSNIPQFVSAVKKYLSNKGLRSICFGHAGDGNVHIDVLKYDIPHEEWNAMLPNLKRDIYKLAIKHEGTITGEHGIGSVRREFLPLAFSIEEIELMKRIKEAFDPKGLLNPGKAV